MDKDILTISLTDDGKTYKVKVAEGASVNEVMFSMAVVIKCMVRDGVVDKHEYLLDMLKNYVTDEQYSELEGSEDESV